VRDVVRVNGRDRDGGDPTLKPDEKRSVKNASGFCHKISQHFTFVGTPGTHQQSIAVDTLEKATNYD
jgi:hypothetical protein